ncbi:hypothetical protein B9Z65_991 [Elsinoe australis]|uniref:Uncharacterized protein n=1 Tax=Elsinoe australis TaxID=40998 RepID=A0A2P8AK68_9PEZI|nr:hypothetical protein B9Z65_991 [Elsinoe australis]
MSQKFPVLFTVGTSNKHDVAMIDPSISVFDLQEQLQDVIEKSPNCEERLSKYSKTRTETTVKGIKVRWSGEPREARLWPASTILTKNNIEAALQLIAMHQGKDVLELEVVTREVEKEPKKEETKEE